MYESLPAGVKEFLPILGLLLVVLAFALTVLRWNTFDAGTVLAPGHVGRAAGWCATLPALLALSTVCTRDALGLRGGTWWTGVAGVGWIVGPYVDAEWVHLATSFAVALLAGQGLELAPRALRACSGLALAGVVFGLAGNFECVRTAAPPAPDPPTGRSPASSRASSRASV